ncbi:glucosamine-6-phosphate isomerase [Microbacterium trichothecenolyticum]|uniref:Glucosamine-6-phosphate isomerase n=1 Tax=Microbacterium trichothecenolyticum TaxID=69370 RepID=A0ABU0TY65_MICTR|nr:glucosamine-6-phosphate isomerase [Microbacterium trichothecenolyticum]
MIDREVTARLGLDPARVHVPDGMADDIEGAAAAYERAIVDAGGVDLQILGIGSTGHIGFNEPTSSFASRTRIKTLTPETRRDNARFFPSLDDVPLHCVTQGLGTIMDARSVLLVAFGEGKADAVAAAVEGPLSSMCPGSILQMHPDATVVVDEAAAARLTLRDYYDFVFENRPEWQR